MSADFIWADVPAARIDADRKKQLLEIIAGLNKESPEMGDSRMFDEIDELRAALIEAVDFLEKAPRSRDTALYSLPGANFEVWLTGGISGGDAPTEMCEHFDVLNCCAAIVDLLMQWAIEDCEAKKAAAQIGATKEDDDD